MKATGIERSKYFPIILRTQVFIAGASIMVLELLGSRMLAPFYGSTLFVWGSLIGVVLLGLSIGYSYGGKRADLNSSYMAFSLLIFGAGTYILVATLASADIFKFVLALNLGERYGPLAAAILFLAIPSFLLGAVSPYAIKLSTKSLASVGKTAGNLYSLSTMGSIVGTFATTFILIPELGISTILYSLSVILIIVSFIGLASRFRALSVILIAISLVSSSSPQIMAGGVMYQKDTLYHNLVVQDDPITGVRTLLLDNHFHSAMDLNDPERIVYSYTKYFHLGLAFKPDVERVLFIGGGGFSGPKMFLNDYPRARVDVVEIDQDVIRVAGEYFMVPDDPRLEVFDEDGRIFLTNTERIYDLIILDAYAKTYVPFHLMTEEFHQLVYDRLSNDGLVISNIITSLDGRSSELFMAEYKTMSSVYPSLYVYPVSSDHGRLVQNVMIIAHKSSDTFTIVELKDRAEGRTKVDLDRILDRQYDGQIELDRAIILTDDHAPVENFLNPLTRRTYVKEIILVNKTVITSPQDVKMNIEPLRLDRGSIIAIVGISVIGLVVLASYNYASSKTRL